MIPPRPELRAALRRAALLPPDRPGPVFREPWHAHAWAMAVALHDQGHFTWAEWAERLGTALAAAPGSDDADPEDDYYRAWLDALEDLANERGLIDEAERRTVSK